MEEWPTPVVVSPWEAGLKLAYQPDDVLADFPTGTFDPVVRAAYTYWPEPPGEGYMDRLWDPMTVLPLVDGDTLVPLSEKGGIAVDEKGVTTFAPNASSNRCYQVASEMDADAVMSRLREIYREGNPSVSMRVSGKPEPGVDYNGSELVFRFENIQLGSFSEGDLRFGFAIDGAEYAPESSEWNETLGVLEVRFSIPSDAVTAGNVYDGTLTVTLENDELGSVLLTTASRRLVQGRTVQAEQGAELVDANLAQINGGDEYATVAEAVAAANGQPVRLLHAASWSPSSSDFGKSFRFLDKSRLVLDVPSDVNVVWSDVDGDNGTLALSKMDPIGVCSWSWHEPMTNIVRRMEANGFKGIQLALSPWVWEGEGSAAQKETFGDQEGEEVFNLISNKFAKGELDIHATMICFSNEDYTTEHTISNTCGFYYGLAPSCTSEQTALADLTWTIRSNQFAKAVERTAALGVRNITAHIGLVHLDDDDMSRLYWACKTCKENGCKLLVETGMYSAGEEVAALACFTNLHPDAEIGLNFDTANQILYGADNPTNAYAVMKDWIEQVHVKDCVETYSARGTWATDVEWGRGDVSRAYDMISVLKADGFSGPMLVEHESGSPDPDVREREILTAVKAIRGEPAPVLAGLGEVLGPYLTAEAAANAARGAAFTPSAEVAEKLGEGTAALGTYCDMFEFDVVPTSGGRWAVGAYLKPPDWTNVVESAQAATRQLPVARIAAWRSGEDPILVPLTNCVPGFYYSLFDGAAVTDLKADIRKANCNVLCGAEKTVYLPEVTPPPGGTVSSFFSIGVLEAPFVIPGETETSTNLHCFPPRGKGDKSDIL